MYDNLLLMANMETRKRLEEEEEEEMEETEDSVR